MLSLAAVHTEEEVRRWAQRAEERAAEARGGRNGARFIFPAFRSEMDDHCSTVGSSARFPVVWKDLEAPALLPRFTYGV